MDLSALVSALAPHAPALPNWSLGGGLYEQFLAAFAPAATSTRPSQPQLEELAAAIAAAAAALKAGGAAAAGQGGEEVVVGGGPSALAPDLIQRRVVLARMASRVHAELMRLLAEAAGKGASEQADVAPGVLRSALALCGAEPALRPAAVGTTAWHLGGSLLKA